MPIYEVSLKNVKVEKSEKRQGYHAYGVLVAETAVDKASVPPCHPPGVPTTVQVGHEVASYEYERGCQGWVTMAKTCAGGRVGVRAKDLKYNIDVSI